MMLAAWRLNRRCKSAAMTQHKAAAELDEPAGTFMAVVNKTDLAPAPEGWCPKGADEVLAISAEERVGLESLEQRLGRDYRSALAEDRILVTNLRHQGSLATDA